jgi:hypothetical protein
MFNHIPLDTVIPKLVQVTDNGTRYYVTPEGFKYPSITTVLSQYNIKHIMEWRARVGEEQANKISRQAAGRGTRIHKICEDYLNNNLPSFKNPLDQDNFNTFKPILNRINNIRCQETKLYSNHLRIAGTVDCIGEFDNKLSVIDFKTSSKPKNREQIENYFMQAAAYAIMFEERVGIPVPKIAILISVDDSAPQVFVDRRDNHTKRLIEFRDLYEKKSGVVL